MRELQGKSLLLVEDNAIIALAEQHALQTQGANVAIAHDGESAVSMATESAFDLILMDIDLGRDRMDGPEAAEHILETRECPIVFLSSHTEPEIVDRTERITSYGYVVKNSGTTVLLAAIRMAFLLHEAHNRQRRILQSVKSCVLIFNHDTGKYEFFNAELERTIGRTLDEVNQMGDDFFLTFHPDDREPLIQHIRALARAQDDFPRRLEYRLKPKHGDWIWCLSSDAPFERDKSGRVIRSLGSFIDITARKNHELHLKDRLKNLELRVMELEQ